MSKSLSEAFTSTVSLVPLAPVLEFCLVYLLIDVTLKSIQIYGKVAKIAQRTPIFPPPDVPRCYYFTNLFCLCSCFFKKQWTLGWIMEQRFSFHQATINCQRNVERQQGRWLLLRTHLQFSWSVFFLFSFFLCFLNPVSESLRTRVLIHLINIAGPENVNYFTTETSASFSLSSWHCKLHAGSPHLLWDVNTVLLLLVLHKIRLILVYQHTELNSDIKQNKQTFVFYLTVTKWLSQQLEQQQSRGTLSHKMFAFKQLCANKIQIVNFFSFRLKKKKSLFPSLRETMTLLGDHNYSFFSIFFLVHGHYLHRIRLFIILGSWQLTVGPYLVVV